MLMKGSRLILLSLAVVAALISGGWLLQRGSSRSQTVFENARLFEDIVAHIAEYAVDSLDEAELYGLAIEGLIEELNDPYATFLGPEEVRELTERTTGDYGGLGMQIDVRDGWITVIAPIAGTPAETAGIESGDRIVEVEGESTYGWRNEKAVRELRGAPGTQVRISIARPGVPEPFDLTLTRASVHVRSVQAALLLRQDVGYVSLAYSTMGSTVVEEVRHAIDSLRDEGAHSLIFDLRDSPGGLLTEGVTLTDLFVDEGEVMVRTNGRNPRVKGAYEARYAEAWPGMPIVVLVNGGTASAAEIIAGALQDHDRALIVGTPTFGKGLVQTIFPLGPENALQLTTGRWQTPNGRTIQRPIRRVGDRLRIVGGAEEERADLAGDTTFVDSSSVFYTDAGRAVVGGGGIRPDVTVRLDTLTDAEQEFSRRLGANIPIYRDVMTSYALELKGDGGITSTDFNVTRSMRNELIRRFRARGIDLPMSVFQGAGEFLDTQLGYETARYVFSRDVEAQRRIRDDAQVARALEILAGVTDLAELFSSGETLLGPARN
jgi:carboxyl-terminal processing protease